MKVVDALKSISSYPIPQQTIELYATVRSLVFDEDISQSNLTSKEFKLTKADLYKWLSYQPNIAELDTSFSNLADAQKFLRNEANKIYKEYDDPEFITDGKPVFGYKGDRL